MDDTQSNRISEAATTRKRRSSILKNLRPSRTPFSELEFNVATPTDTAKSRRVSFSRRTGVAEFVTNEATNTWKTIYVEQNKSLESSENDSVMNQPHQTVGCLGKRIFDQQFEEIEVVDYGGNIITTDNMRMQQMNMSMNVNFTQQIASLECDLDERKLVAPQQNFELSALTEHKSNIFGDDLPITVMEDVSNKIDINFSSLQPIGLGNDKYDDLDEIQKAFLTSEPKNFQGPFMDKRNISEYTEVDLNMTHIGMKNDDFDMSITDTIQSPKVQEVSKSNMSFKSDNLFGNNNDWVADKENIVMNPYIAPKESVNFAINEIPDQVLVFDGRKLTVQSDKNVMNNKDVEQNFCKVNLPNNESLGQPPHRKTFVLNLNDDLPNFVTPTPLNGQIPGLSDKYEDSSNKDILTKQIIPERSDLLPNLHNTIIYDGGDIANISVTQAIPSNILGKSEKRKTIVFEDDTGNLSMTQVVPTNVMASNEMQLNKTVLYEEDNISFTQAVPVNAVFNKTNVLENAITPAQNDFVLSFTQAVPNNLVISNKVNQTNKRSTIVFENDSNNISITRVLPSNILNSENQIELPVTIEDNSVSGKVKEQVLSENNRLSSIGDRIGSQDVTKLNDKYQCDISETRILSTNIIDANQSKSTQIKQILRDTVELKNNLEGLSITNENFGTNMSITEAIPDKIFYSNKIIDDKTNTLNDVNDICDISVTQVLPSNIITDPEKKCLIRELEHLPIDNRDAVVEKCTNIQRHPEKIAVFSDHHNSSKDKTTSDSDLQLGSIFTTSSNKTPLDKTNTVELNISVKAVNECTKMYKSLVDMSITQIVQPNDLLPKRNDVSKRETIVYDGDKNDISVTRSIKTNILLGDMRSEMDRKPLCDEKENNRENLTSISVCNCMVITSKQPGQIHICTHSNFSISREVTDDHTTNKQSEVRGEKIGVESDEVNVPNTSSIKNSTPVSEQNEILLKSMNYLDGITQNLETSSHKSVTDHNYQDVFVYQAVTSHNVSKHQVGRIEQNEETIEGTTKDGSKKSVTDLNGPDQNFNRSWMNDTLYEKKSENKEVKKSHKKQKRHSFLSKLLNMSNESLNYSSEGIDDKNIMAVIESHSEIETEDKIKSKTKELAANPPEVDSALKEEGIGTKSCLYKKKEIDNNTRSNNSNKKSLSSNSENVSNKNKKNTKTITDSDNKYLREADDTNDLLEMLSDFTDKTLTKESKLVDYSIPIDVKDEINTDQRPHHVTSEDKELKDVERASITKSRISVMISREDLLSNISMVQAALEQAKNYDDSEMFNGTNDTTVEEPHEIVEEVDRRSRQARVSTEVVKTLQFDDSTIDVASKSNENLSPLKKTTFGDISSLKDGKGKVIPEYLMDVPDEVKSLMKDLVKPAADVMPFETGVDKIIDKMPKEQASTNSIEIQANIITSSQIDLDVDSDLVSECIPFEPGKLTAGDKIPHPTALTRTKLGSSDAGDDTGNVSYNFRKNAVPKPYLVFDRVNPLNNVILSPTDMTEVHNYQPINTIDSKATSETAVHVMEAMSEHSARISISDRDEKSEERVQLVTTQYNVKIDQIRSDRQIDDANKEMMAEPSFIEVVCEKKPISDLVDDDEKNIKDTEVNTLIAMKCDRDLLQTSSSLTIIDEDRPDVVVVLDKTVVISEKKSKKTSPVKVIFKLDDQNDENSELSELSVTDSVKAKKRTYSPAKYEHQRKVIPPGPETTPKHCNKMQKLSNSPLKNQSHRASTAKMSPTSVVEQAALESDKPFGKSGPAKKSPKSYTSSKPKNSVIVQRMIAECNMSNEKATNDLRIYGGVGSEFSSSSTLKTETISQRDFSSAHATDSLMSSEGVKEADCMPSSVTTTTSEGVASLSSDTSQTDCPAELEDQDFTLHTDTDCDANVISKIDKLPFIETRECEWEHSDADSWRFLLMRKTLRLTVRLKREPGELSRRCVHGDAPVACTAVEQLHEERDAVAAACARLASEAMRYECVRGAALAGGVPALLRRCVAVARVARRWARAMHEARVHLAYTLADSGRLVLRVANVPLRSVYEVTMRIELVVEDAREAAWARAGHVTLRDVTDDQGEWGEGVFEAPAGLRRRADEARDAALAHADDVTERWVPEVQRVMARVSHDWGHVPRTLWKVFRFLKNKTKDDLLGA